MASKQAGVYGGGGSPGRRPAVRDFAGVVVAAVVSILLLIHHVARPHVAFLGRIPGTRRFSDLARHQDNERIPGVLAFRVESGIVYFNVDHVFRVVLDRVDAELKRYVWLYVISQLRRISIWRVPGCS